MRACVGLAVTDDSFVLETRHKGKQWLVKTPQSDLLSIMTPIFPDTETLGFLRNQVAIPPTRQCE